MNLDNLAKIYTDRMRVRGWPEAYRVTTPEHFANRGKQQNTIVIWYDEEQGDKFASAAGVQRNPRRHTTRVVGLVAYVFGKSGKSGATASEHAAQCEKNLHLLISAIENVADVEEHRVQFDGGKFIGSKEIATIAPLPSDWAGALYELKFAIAGSITDVDYAGEGLETAELESVATTLTPPGFPE